MKRNSVASEETLVRKAYQILTIVFSWGVYTCFLESPRVRIIGSRPRLTRERQGIKSVNLSEGLPVCLSSLVIQGQRSRKARKWELNVPEVRDWAVQAQTCQTRPPVKCYNSYTFRINKQTAWDKHLAKPNESATWLLKWAGIFRKIYCTMIPL